MFGGVRYMILQFDIFNNPLVILQKCDVTDAFWAHTKTDVIGAPKTGILKNGLVTL